ncbi:MAG: TrkA family potassium uptake protein [Candidatus Latescibacteria bacterium]|nr:TrkA family potassium uptake protein [Candidatus Latescibacterota bacterium]
MYIVIAGAGMVGSALARKLMQAKHDVVIIDQNKETCDNMYAEIGVIAIYGNAARIEILNEAAIEKADVAIAATGSDADNLACAILAKSFGVPRIIVRMRNPAYEKAYRLAGVTSIVRVLDLMVNQMIMEIEQPRVRRIVTIGGGKADIFMVNIPQGANVAGRSVEAIAKHPKFPSQCVFIAVYSEQTEEFSFPRGERVIREGDEVFLISTAEDIKMAADFLTAG